LTGASTVFAAELRAGDVFFTAAVTGVLAVWLVLVGVLLTVAFLLLVVGCVSFVLTTSAPR
jgi:hypothetical protein